MKKIIFLADVFYSQLREDPSSIREYGGGGEMVNDIVIHHLRQKGYDVKKVNTITTTPEYIEENKDAFFLVGNFIHLKPECFAPLYERDYAIVEHDHKYLMTRDPSPFEANGYIAPSNLIINAELYQKAKAIFCQSKLHSQILSDNLMIKNVINLGCSIWSDEQMEAIEKYSKTPKTKKLAILQSDNPIKGTKQSMQICKQKNLPFELIPPCGFEDLMKEMSKFEMLLTQPQVIETFCRVLVEARMLGCKVASNHRNGCTSESWFTELSGQELVDFVKEQRVRVLGTFERLVEGETKEDEFFAFSNTIREPKKDVPNAADVTVILNAYRRPYNLQMQIEAIRNQTKPPKEIWLWINAHEDNANFDFSTLDVDRVVHNDFNWKFYGRFSLGLLADTEFVAIYDDDTIPGIKWHENCLMCMDQQEGIMGAAGYVQSGPRAMQYHREGWPSKNNKTERVDYVGHAWFFKRDWLSYLWAEKPPTWHNGEDIHFSYTAQKHGGIQTYCPPHPEEDFSMHGSLYGYELGVDSKATSNNQAVSHQQFFSQRDMCIGHSIKNGWNTVKGVKN